MVVKFQFSRFVCRATVHYPRHKDTNRFVILESNNAINKLDDYDEKIGIRILQTQEKRLKRITSTVKKSFVVQNEWRNVKIKHRVLQSPITALLKEY